MIPQLVATGLVVLLICGLLWYYIRSWSDFWGVLCIMVPTVLVVVFFGGLILLFGEMIASGLWPWDPQFWEAGT